HRNGETARVGAIERAGGLDDRGRPAKHRFACRSIEFPRLMCHPATIASVLAWGVGQVGRVTVGQAGAGGEEDQKTKKPEPKEPKNQRTKNSEPENENPERRTPNAERNLPEGATACGHRRRRLRRPQRSARLWWRRRERDAARSPQLSSLSAAALSGGDRGA